VLRSRNVGAKRRGRGEDAVYFDHEGGECRDARSHQRCPGRWRGVVSLGYGPDGKRIRRKVSGRTKTAVADALKALHDELGRGLHTSRTYTVRRAVDDWLHAGLPGRSERTRSVYREATAPLLEQIGSRPLRELTARDVRTGLDALSATLSTRYLQIARAALARAIKHAEAHDLVGRNVALLVDPPKGQDGRSSRSFTLDQAHAVLGASTESRLNAYVVLSLTVGIRTEEARELRWDHLDLEGDPDAEPPVPASVAVWRSVREGGDTKTPKSRRTLALPQTAVRALKEHRKRQAEDRLVAGPIWQDHGLVFAQPLVRLWTPRMSGANSGGSPHPQASAKAGHLGTCVTPSCPSCQPTACPSRRSPAWPGITGPPLRSSSTGTSCAR
jgi:hypothetical protein